MASSVNPAVDENLPLAVRRPRRSIAGTREQDIIKQESKARELAPEFKTPRKKRVRFSDPVLPSSCRTAGTGLTPMVRRTSLGATPSSSRKRSMSPGPGFSLDHRVSTPAAFRRRTSGGLPSTHHHTTDSSSLHSTIDGRVERRQRREAFRARFQQLESAHQRTERQARERITVLQAQLRAREREVHELQNATIIEDTDRICDLEQLVDELQGKLQEAEAGHRNGRRSPSVASSRTSIADWTMAARDPFGEQDDDMDLDMDYDIGEEEGFGDATIAQFACSTPTKTRTGPSGDAASSFLTPPATSPCELPMATPSHLRFQQQQDDVITPFSASAGVQAELLDLEKQLQIDSLQREMDKLTSSLNAYKSLVKRLGERLPPSPEEEGAEDDSNDNTLEPRIENVLRTLSDRAAVLTDLTSSVTSLGFLGKDASEMLASMASGFRSARLELEYLTPGEITLPLSAHGAEVLDLLLMRLRELAKKAQEGDDAVDEYHAIELNLRQQLEARVLAMDDLRAELKAKQDQLDEKSGEVEGLKVGNDRFKGALEDYERDIHELQCLVEKMEADATANGTTIEERDATVADLEEKLTVATRHAADLKDELEVSQASRKKHLACVNRRSGEALALRDARVAELRGEIDQINAALRDAHETIREYRVGEKKLRDENGGLQAVVDGMRDQLAKAERLMERHRGHEEKEEEQNDNGEQTGKYLSGGLARRLSSRKKRRPDSGLGFLDEEEIDA